ncbi:MAG: SH3 domain-containing protein [Saprospiraceae bacterium]
MTKKKKSSLLPKIEILIILVFFFSFIIWAVSQCSAKKVMYQAQEMAAQGETETTVVEPDTVPVANPATTTTLPATTSSTDLTTTNVPVRIVQERYTPLYVSIEGLNLRTGPHLDSSIILKLGLFEEVLFLNEVSDSTQIINMGEEMANEPWIKVQEKKGNVGWVYGAGINYYKRKRSGF